MFDGDGIATGYLAPLSSTTFPKLVDWMNVRRSRLPLRPFSEPESIVYA